MWYSVHRFPMKAKGGSCPTHNPLVTWVPPAVDGFRLRYMLQQDSEFLCDLSTNLDDIVPTTDQKKKKKQFHPNLN